MNRCSMPRWGAWGVRVAATWVAGTAGVCSAEEYRWIDEAGKFRDLLAGDRPVARYVYEPLDASTPERREATYKPFHHVYTFDGEGFLTKGPGGRFSHHRGIFLGFSKCSFTNAAGNQETVDTWHSRKGYTEHLEFENQEILENGGRHRVRIAWRSDASGTFLTEERGLQFREKDGGLQVDFHSELSTGLERVRLDGDPQHAGFQFRASNEVAEDTKSQTYYIRPGTGKAKPGKTINAPRNITAAEVPGTRNLPWKAMSVVVGGQRYTIAYLDHPSNPKPADYSERDYGRFGSYFVAEVTPDDPVSIRYRLFIRKGELTAEDVAALSAEFVRE